MPLSKAPGEPTEGETHIGPYVLLRVLGSGGMARVYLARQTTNGRDVALKVMSGAESPEARQRLRRGAEATAGLSHPHILKVFDLGEEAGQFYVAMEQMQGGTLRSAMSGKGVPPDIALKWADQIGQALDTAHSQGVIHGDIKPENVLLDAHGNAFLSDFGACPGQPNLSLPQSVAPTGSVAYMSPEQWSGAEADTRTDMYAFAATLFELLSGRPPFVAPTLSALMTEHAQARVPSITSLNAALPRTLDSLFSKALSKNPALRFGTALAMVEALRSTLASKSPPPPSSAARDERRARPGRLRGR